MNAYLCGLSRRYMFGNMLGKLQELRQEMEKVKTRLAETLISRQSGDGAIRVTLSASREIRELHIDPVLLEPEEASRLEAALMGLLNEGLREADRQSEEAMKSAAGGLLGGLNLPGLF